MKTEIHFRSRSESLITLESIRESTMRITSVLLVTALKEFVEKINCGRGRRETATMRMMINIMGF
ncbi:hypothetical protein AXX17_AT1G63660 [Arabidopsis thaliana]|uniref:Uncharacterized protein n=1 Tax=Arabidopsis thaliana TaxID=3702 RepID=A0A178W1P4_ARATH|nr:hypothetical protein AXX17_AT1G63660 [Arabidopsis thaliana]